MNIQDITAAARQAAEAMTAAETERKNRALTAMAEKLAVRRAEILAANEADLEAARAAGLSQNVVERLRFGEARIDSRIRSLEKIAALPDPVGQCIRTDLRPNGLLVRRVRVPLGVILMIYEARPHVTVNAGAFCLKAGNAAILRGGSEARNCNTLMGRLWREVLEEAGLPGKAVQVISGTHEEIHELLQQEDAIDLVIPRGGKGLIETVSRTSRIPVIKHYAGICHVFLDEGAELAAGVDIALDSKCLMPEVCNAMETMLVHKARQSEIPAIVHAFEANGVTVRGCGQTRAVVPHVARADEEDWLTEYLDLKVSIRVVDNVGAAIAHINRYGSHHTDVIVTDSVARAGAFVREVDSGVVLVNASTMFCDGESLGMGAEIGISTDKLHARGPMGLEELTSYKLVIEGQGTIMGPSRLPAS